MSVVELERASPLFGHLRRHAVLGPLTKMFLICDKEIYSLCIPNLRLNSRRSFAALEAGQTRHQHPDGPADGGGAMEHFATLGDGGWESLSTKSKENTFESEKQKRKKRRTTVMDWVISRAVYF